MTEAVVAGFLFLAGALIFALAVIILAVGARVWIDAATAAHRTRAHGAQADETQMTIEAVADATEEIRAARVRQPLPSDEELREAVLAERRIYANGHAREEDAAREWTTEGNEGIEEVPPIPPGGQYIE